jgi:filamentous hemagglutinin
VKGFNVLAPKLYLSQNSRDRLLGNDSTNSPASLATAATIFAKDNLTIDAANADLRNNGAIKSDNNITLNLASFTNKTNSPAQAEIAADKNLTITATEDIKNLGAKISATQNLTLTSTAGSILSSALVATNDANLLNSNADSYVQNAMPLQSDRGNIRSELLASASISGGNVSINAANDFTNLAAEISANKNTLADSSTTSGNLSISAGDDVTLGTLQLRNRSESSWGNKKKGGTSISDNLTNIGSNIESAGNLAIISTGLFDEATSASINIIGSNVSAANNGSLISDFGNVNIINAVDSRMSQTTSSKKGSYHSRFDSVYDYQESAVESNLNFGGDLVVDAALGSMNLIGSGISTDGDLEIGSFAIARNPDGSYKTNANGTFQTVSGESVLGLNIKAAELKSEHLETHQKSKIGLGDTLKLAFNPVEQMKLMSELSSFAYSGSFGKETMEINRGPRIEKTSYKSNKATTTQHSASLEVGGNLMLNSTGDVNVAASNIDVAGSALLNVDGNFNIASAAESTKSSNKNQEIEIGEVKLTKDLSHVSASGGMHGSGVGFEDALTVSSQKSSNVNIGGSLLANVTDSLVAADSGNMTLVASNLSVGGDSIIKTAGDFSLTDAQETSSYSSKESILEVETGGKAGNAYVDVAYAWKAVVDAQKKAVQAAEKLKKMKGLRDEGKASDKAVELAAAQLVLAQTAVAAATLAATAATAGAAAAAGTSMGTGFYGAAYTNITSSGIKNTTEYSISKASNFVGYGDIDIGSANDLNILGSVLASANEDISLSARNDIKIEAGTNTLTQNSKQETTYGGGSVGNNGVQLNIGFSNGESDYSKIFYTNSQVSAENGALSLTTGNDANISGANLLAKNILLNLGNDLNVSSKQTGEDFSSGEWSSKVVML